MLRREFSIANAQLTREAKDGDLIVDMAFSSEEPYERWWGIEVLDHNEKSIRLDRLNSGAPILFNHNWDDLRGTHQPGSVRIGKDKVLRGKARITAVTQSGRDAIGLVETKVLTKTSVGYQIHNVIEQTTTKSGEKVERYIDGRAFEGVVERMSRDKRGDLAAFRREIDAIAGPLDRASDEPSIFRVVDWEPLENSLVTVPADNTVGVGRNLENDMQATAETAPPSVDDQLNEMRAALKEQGDALKKLSQPAAPAANKGGQMAEQGAAAGDVADKAKETRTVEAQPKQGPNAMEMEGARKRGIYAIAEANRIEEKVRDYWISAGLSLDQVADDVLAIVKARSEDTKSHPAYLGLSSKEKKEFSIARMIHACASNDYSQAGFEVDCSREVAKRLNKTPTANRFCVPLDIQSRPVEVSRRDLTVASAGGGGYLVGTQNMGFIELLRNRSVAFRMGAMRLSGLRESVTVPRQSVAGTAYWLANEATDITESQQTFVQMALTPKNVGAYTEISRQLLLQSNPAADAIVTSDLAAQVAIAADLAALEGSGAAGQPTGISATSGIGSVTGTSLAAAGVLEFQSDVAAANVMPERGGYVTTPAVAALLMIRPELPTTGTERLWKGNLWDGSLFNFPAMSSNQLTAATMIFGDWSKLVIGEWGTLEIDVNPYADFKKAIVGVRAIYTMDVGVRLPAAFSRATSIT